MEKMIKDNQFGYFNTNTWEFIPVDKMKPGRVYFLNTLEHLEQAKLWHEMKEKEIRYMMWGKTKQNDFR